MIKKKNRKGQKESTLKKEEILVYSNFHTLEFKGKNKNKINQQLKRKRKTQKVSKISLLQLRSSIEAMPNKSLSLLPTSAWNSIR